MITSIYIDYLTNYKTRLESWVKFYAPSYLRKIGTPKKLNENQKRDHEMLIGKQNKVICEINRIERELQSLKISTSKIFKNETEN
jgi:hypothetical protein